MNLKTPPFTVGFFYLPSEKFAYLGTKDDIGQQLFS